MSAIWGCIDLRGNAVAPDVCQAMQRPFEACRLDRLASRTHLNACMGSGLQYLNKESEDEALPMLDEEEGLLFTADVYIFNREELIAQLCPDWPNVPDGQLFYLGYKKWRADVPKHIYGSYAYAVYEYRANRLLLGVDHTVTRSLYYYLDDGKVYFSTLVEPIFCAADSPPQLNEEWMAIFLALTSYAILTDASSTPYQDVWRVEAAHYCAFTADGRQSLAYWSPEEIEPLRLSSDAAYRDRFRALMEQCAQEALRTDGEVGIMLSSGLDSSSVAAFVAPILQTQGKRLHAYTHVPIESFQKQSTRNAIFDEREGVLRLCEMYPNLNPHFLSTPECNGVLSLKRLMPYGLFPVKSTTNIAWIDALVSAAKQDGCKVMLSGQYGNVTISRGSMDTYLQTVLSQGRLIRFGKSLRAYSRYIQVRRKRILEALWDALKPSWVKRMFTRDYLKNSLINRDFAARTGVSSKDRRLERDLQIMTIRTFAQERRYVYDSVAMAHVSDTDTKISLHHGVHTLDITKDIRIIAFCLSLPMECFCDCDTLPQTRRLVRTYLGDLLPGELLSETAPRGRQSADALERLQACWPEAYAELERVCLSPRMREMADEAGVRRLLSSIRDALTEDTFAAVKQLLYVYAAGLFLENHQWRM